MVVASRMLACVCGHIFIIGYSAVAFENHGRLMGWSDDES